MPQLKIILATASVIFLLVGTTALAMDITLTWNPNEEPNVAGYKLYYKAGTPDLPLDGLNAAEGDSPIDVGTATTVTLNVPDDGQIYYFAVTAYNTSGYESSYSSIVASDWVPALLAPEPGTTDVTPVMFSWSEPPVEYPIDYFTLIYGTDPALPLAGATIAEVRFPAPVKALAGVTFIGLVGLNLGRGRARKKLLALMLLATLAAVTATGCGGGSGGEDGSSAISPVVFPGGPNDASDPGAPDNQTATASGTMVVTNLIDSYYTAVDLQAGLTYYWKVIAVDDMGYEYSSVTGSFIAE